MQRKATIYTKRNCPYCESAKRFFDSHEIAYEAKDLTDDPEALKALVEKTNHRTVPQIFLGERFVGGYSELVALHDSGGLDQWRRGR